ncbi:hypothetical protein MHYP_G00169640 [Metynnis hypsauchen]
MKRSSEVGTTITRCLKHLNGAVMFPVWPVNLQLVFSSSPGGDRRRNINKLLGVSARNLSPVASTCLLYRA